MKLLGIFIGAIVGCVLLNAQFSVAAEDEVIKRVCLLGSLGERMIG